MTRTAVLGFGVYVPKYRITVQEIASRWQEDGAALAATLGVKEKSVPGKDEDSFTLAYEAAEVALETAGISRQDVSAVFVGSESHPYAVKPTSGMLVSALRLNPFSHAADLEFACKAGTAAIQIIDSFVRSGQIKYGLAIGTDTAQGRPGDALEYTAGAGSAAVVIGPADHIHALCRIDATISYTTDTPDFWRARGEEYPRHAGRFTGEPAYFKHMRETMRAILSETRISVQELQHVVLHMPNAKFPVRLAKEFGITDEQLRIGFIVPQIGNTYSACSLLGLASVLQKAKKGERVLVVSYGSGSGCDAFLMTMLKDGVSLPADSRALEYLNYSEYLENTGALAH